MELVGLAGLPRFELGLSESKSDVLTITQQSSISDHFFDEGYGRNDQRPYPKVSLEWLATKTNDRMANQGEHTYKSPVTV